MSAEAGLRAVMLGSGGWMATRTRATSSLLVTTNSGAMLLDAGTGVAALCRQPDLLDGTHDLAVVLSHFHLDHVVGLTYLPALAGRVGITLWAPGRLLADTASETILGSLVGSPFLSVGLHEFTTGVFEIVAGTNQISSLWMDARVQPLHPGGSVAFRLGDNLAYCTDTAPDRDTAPFVQGVTVLVHEAWSPASATHEHSSAESAARTAAEAGVGHLVLSHIHPLNDDPVSLLGAAQPVFDATEVGRDGLTIG